MKNRSHRYDTNRPKSKDMGTNVVNTIIMRMMLIFSKQHPKLNSSKG